MKSELSMSKHQDLQTDLNRNRDITGKYNKMSNSMCGYLSSILYVYPLLRPQQNDFLTVDRCSITEINFRNRFNGEFKIAAKIRNSQRKAK